MSTDLLASWPVDLDATGDPVPPIGSTATTCSERTDHDR